MEVVVAGTNAKEGSHPSRAAGFGCRAWQERGRSIPDPVGQRRGRKLEALAFEPGALAGERPMHSILVEEGWSRADEDR